MGAPLSRPPEGIELLDDPLADPQLVATSLGNVARANRWFGGRGTVRAGLRMALRDHAPADGTVSLLDVGTGFGDLALDAVQWGRRRGLAVQPFGAEWSAAAARLAAGRGVPTVRATGLALPWPDRSVDLTVISQVLHHLPDPAGASLVAECARVSRLAVIVADLRRVRWAEWAFAIGARLLRFDPVTIQDGGTSIRRGYSRSRLETILRAAGCRTPYVRRHPFARYLALWRLP